MYAVGSEYAHAEARKSPVVDGKVLRNQRGKEQRYPLILTGIEKEIARKVVLAFGQTICGFDLLRSGGRSYVCDVNGWSFVKDSPKFWVDSANLLRQYCLEAIDPAHLERFPLGTTPLDHKPLSGSRSIINPNPLLSMSADDLPQLAAPGASKGSELLCVVAVTRHGDRTPKQKLKFSTSAPEILALHAKSGVGARDELKIKKVRPTEELLSPPRHVTPDLTPHISHISLSGAADGGAERRRRRRHPTLRRRAVGGARCGGGERRRDQGRRSGRDHRAA